MGESLFSSLVQSPVLWLCSRAAPTYEYYTHALTYTNGERAQNTEYREIGVAAAPDRGAAITDSPRLLLFSATFPSSHS